MLRTKWVIAALTIGVLTLTGMASAAVPGGTYSGAARVRVDGTSATHPFSLTVKKAEIVKVVFLASGSCADLEATGGLSVAIPIVKNAFDSSISVNGDTIKLVGAFTHAKVAGTMSGTLDASAVGKHCAVAPARFSATRG